MPRLWSASQVTGPVERPAVQVHEGYGARRIDPLAELELLDQLASAQQAAPLLLADRARLEDDRRGHRLTPQRHRHLLVEQGVVGRDGDACRRSRRRGRAPPPHRRGRRRRPVPGSGWCSAVRGPGSPCRCRAGARARRRGPTRSVPRQDPGLGTPLRGGAAEPEEDAVADRALVDRLPRVEHLVAEVEVDGPGQGRHVRSPGERDHVGGDVGAGAAQGGRQIADPGLGGVVEDNIVPRVRLQSCMGLLGPSRSSRAAAWDEVRASAEPTSLFGPLVRFVGE